MAQGEISLWHHYRSSTDFYFFFYATSWHLVAHCPIPFFTPPRGTERKSSTHCSNAPHNYVARETKPNTTVRPQRTLTKASRPTSLSRDKQDNRGNSVNNFFGTQLAKQKNKTAPRYIATLIHKKQTKERKQTSTLSPDKGTESWRAQQNKLPTMCSQRED